MICIYESPEKHYGVGDRYHSPKQWFYEFEDEDYEEAAERVYEAIEEDGEIPLEVYLYCHRNDEQIEFPVVDILDILDADRVLEALRKYVEKRSS